MGEISERAAVRRLHDRLGFGLGPGDAAAGYDAAVRRLLAAADEGGAKPAPELKAPADRPRKGEKLSKEAKKAANKARVAQEVQVTGWWLDRMVSSGGAVNGPAGAATERLTWFWHGHFATSEQKVRSPQLMLAQNQTFRKFARGSFTELAQALVVDAAMIRWLDGNDNREGSPNENLAREFLELFTLGIGHYAETDVFEGARALTGWTIRRNSTEARFVPSRHDSGSKTMLGKTGNFDAKGFVDLALAKPESAPFVIGRLWFRLVSATPPSAATLQRLVAAYGVRRDIGAVLKAITAESTFRDSTSALVKQPVEWAVGLMRALGVQPSRLDDKTRVKVLAGLRGMGQLPLRPPSVGGWPSGGSWLTTSAGVTRLQLALLLARNSELGQLQRSSARVDGVRALLGVDQWSTRTRDALAGVTEPAQLVAVAACAPEYVVSG